MSLSPILVLKTDVQNVTFIASTFFLTEELEGKVKSRANYERLQELQSSLVWPSITELDPKTYVPEVRGVYVNVQKIIAL